jgi:hypothetical protein
MNKLTSDQIMSVMLQHGTPKQQQEVLAHLTSSDVALPKQPRHFFCTKCLSNECAGDISAANPACKKCGYLGFANDVGYTEAQLLDYGARIRADEREHLAASFHYPDCWDTACYQTLEDALHEMQAWFKCSNDDCAIRKGESE